jgi:16S rRNA (uracil1498-N3)-methyltransferase
VKHRLYLPRLAETNPVSGTLFELAPEQAHYLSRVLRLKPDSDLAVFDGQGREWLARVTAKAALITIIELRCEEPPPTPLILVQSWLKGAAMDRVVQKATELGVTAVWLLSARRSNVKLDERRMASKLSHLVRVAASAAEQCKTLWLPAFDRYEDLSDVLNARGSLQTLMKLVLRAETAPLAALSAIRHGWGWER